MNIKQAGELERILRTVANEKTRGRPTLTLEEFRQLLRGNTPEQYDGQGYYLLAKERPKSMITKNSPKTVPMHLGYGKDKTEAYIWVPTGFKFLTETFEKLSGVMNLYGHDRNDYCFLDAGAGDGRTGLIAEIAGFRNVVLWEADGEMRKHAEEVVREAGSMLRVNYGNGIDGMREFLETGMPTVAYVYFTIERTTHLLKETLRLMKENDYIVAFLDDIRKNICAEGRDRLLLLSSPPAGESGAYIYRISS